MNDESTVILNPLPRYKIKDCGLTKVTDLSLRNIEVKMAEHNLKLKNMHQVMGIVEDSKRSLRKACMFVQKWEGNDSQNLKNLQREIDNLMKVQQKIQKEYFS